MTPSTDGQTETTTEIRQSALAFGAPRAETRARKSRGREKPRAAQFDRLQREHPQDKYLVTVAEQELISTTLPERLSDENNSSISSKHSFRPGTRPHSRNTSSSCAILPSRQQSVRVTTLTRETSFSLFFNCHTERQNTKRRPVDTESLPKYSR